MRTNPRKTNDSLIARQRRALGITQQQLADAIGCTQADLSCWERGIHSPSVKTALKIAEVLKLPVEQLIDTDDDE